MQIPFLSEKLTSWTEYIIESTSSTTAKPTTSMGPLTRLTVLLAAVFPAAVVSDSPSSMPKITSVTFSGSGCKNDAKLSGGLSSPTISYDDFTARYPGTSHMVTCQVHLQGSGASPGWQFALKDNWVKGKVWLQPGTSLDYYTTVFFSQDAANTGTVKNTISNTGGGTVERDVVLRNNLAPRKIWSPCTDGDGYTGILNVNFRGILSGEEGRAWFKATSQNWEVEWRQC